MKIAVCDDDKNIISSYDDLLAKISSIIPKLEYDVFFTGESLIAQYAKAHEPYDIIFLDIEMEGMDGIETAKKIRIHDDSVMIVYVTNHTEYVFESFEVSPFRFLVKPVAFEKFREIFLASYTKIQSNKKVIYFTADRKEFRLYCKEIYYIESQKRNLIIHTSSGNYKVYGKLETFVNQLYENDFICVHKSYLVNFNHVIEFNLNSLKIINGENIPISENKHKYAKEEHMKYILRGYTHDR